MLHLSKWVVGNAAAYIHHIRVEKGVGHCLLIYGKSGVVSTPSSHSLIEYFFFFLKAVFTSFSDGSALTLMIYIFWGFASVVGSPFSSNT